MAARKKTAPPFTPPGLDTLLGGLDAATFLRDYWQKKPLLVRQAVPGFGAMIVRDALLDMACREDAESRLVRQSGGRWHVEYGPQDAARLARLPKRNWTVLVQGVNTLHAGADALMRAFDFIPYARLDDLMVSYAPTGGGVGPHYDSYDVFLIQGIGHRRWEIGAQQDKTLVGDAPLRILRNFQPEEVMELAPGDMLYLPPQYAHNGIAMSDCMTWSVGFRAYPAQDIVTQFLIHLQDTLQVEGVYSDPDLKATDTPARIPGAMLGRFRHMLKAISWRKRDVDHFVGAYLSEPKAHILFDPPARPLSYPRFSAAAARTGITLDRRSALLYRKASFYMDGEHTTVAPALFAPLATLANTRRLPPAPMTDEPLGMLLYEWYLAGYLAPGR